MCLKYVDQPTRLLAMSYRRRHLPYGQGPSLPRWLRMIYLWLMIALSSSFVAWLGFRAFAGATRGDLPAAFGSLAIGAVAATIVTWALFRRRTHR